MRNKLLAIAALMAVTFTIFSMFIAGQYMSYKFGYERFVESTIREMVKEEALNGG